MLQVMHSDLPCDQEAPPCGATCGKLLLCGRHHCQERCHFGPCPEACLLLVDRSCTCGHTQRRMPCSQPLRCRYPRNSSLPAHLLLCSSSHLPEKPSYVSISTGSMRLQVQEVRLVPRWSLAQSVLRQQSCMGRCEKRCTAIRNCGRHPCKRRCCNGNCPPCDQVQALILHI